MLHPVLLVASNSLVIWCTMNSTEPAWAYKPLVCVDRLDGGRFLIDGERVTYGSGGSETLTNYRRKSSTDWWYDSKGPSG